MRECGDFGMIGLHVQLVAPHEAWQRDAVGEAGCGIKHTPMYDKHAGGGLAASPQFG